MANADLNVKRDIPEPEAHAIDVRNIRWRSVCDSDPARQPRSAILALVNLIPVVGLT
jgi:hypothetical protein